MTSLCQSMKEQLCVYEKYLSYLYPILCLEYCIDLQVKVSILSMTFIEVGV